MTDGERATTAGRAACAGLLLLAVWLAAGARFDLRPRPADSDSTFDVEAAMAGGDYRGAENAARQRIARLERDRWSHRGELAHTRDQLVEALLAGGKAADGLTLQLAQSNLDTNRLVFGSSSDEVAISLHRLGDVHFQRGEYARAVELHEQGLNLRMRQSSADEQNLADSLERLAAAQMRMERYDVALAHLERARAIRVRRAAEEPLRLATTLEQIAWLYRYSGNYVAARAPLETALATRRRLTPGHPALVTTIELQGDLQLLEGDVAAAATIWHEALALAERTLGPQHPVISTLERRLTLSADAVGNRTEARRRLDRALLIAERTRSECDPELIGVIDYSANSLTFDGEYVEARRRYARTLSLTEKCLGPNHSNTATVVFNLALLATQMGVLPEAERLYRRAIQAWSTLGPAHPYVATGLDALAEVLEATGDLSGAKDLLERALTIRRNIRSDHPDVAWTLTNIARVIAVSGDENLALRHLAEATDIYKRSGASTEPDHLARTISLRGDIEARRSNDGSARVDFQEALSLRERMFGPNHPLTEESRLKVASADFALGRYDDALAAARHARQSGLDHVKFTVRYLPERRALAYAAKTVNGLGLELSLATIMPGAVPSQFFDAVIRSRSIVLDELSARTETLSDPRSEIAALQTRLNSARQRFANLMLRSMSAEGTSPIATDLLNVARQEREQAEQALAEQSAAFRSQLARADVGFDEVRASLPLDSALVSFVRYERTIAPSVARHPSSAIVLPSYVVFVLRSGAREPSIVPLGEAAAVDDLVTQWRRQMIADAAGAAVASGNHSLEAIGNDLRGRVWDPLAIHIKGAARVFIVPDGALNLFPIAALPAGAGRYLVEQQPVLHYFAAERDVVRSDGSSGTSSGLLAIGGPAFADTSSFAALSRSRARSVTPAPSASDRAVGKSEQTLRANEAECPSFQSISFGALPASSIEAETIARLWDQIQTSAPSQARVLTGALATERAFKELSARRRILHLATHGFFLGEECLPGVEGTRAVGGLTTTKSRAERGRVELSRHPIDVIENPLLFSGLALAGANRRASAGLDEEDGILTAEEVAALNLEGVEWAVLSACNTGLGTVAAGEGVLGLRRAFQLAGVRTVIMSLWSVEDRAARLWMEALYRARLVDRFDTANSVRQASLAVLQERRSRGQSDHPFYWASFVAAGDWR